MAEKPAIGGAEKRVGRGGRVGRAGRASTVRSKLIDPETPAYAVASEFQQLVHMPNPQALFVVLGAMAGNMLSGKPVWLFVAGPSSSGKTMLLQSLEKLERVVTVSKVTGDAAWLSGTAKKDRAADATGGLLPQIGENGCLVFMDLTAMLSESKEALSSMLGTLREVYDGTYKRNIGGEGGREIVHKGRVCIIAGVTNAIDRVAEVSNELGARSLYYRLPASTGYQEASSAVQAIHPEQDKQRIQDLVDMLFHMLGMGFKKPLERRRLENWEAHRIVLIAQLGAVLRTTVPRDWRSREIVDVADPEMPSRMAQQLTQLYLGMECIGVDEGERWEALQKVALDSMPLIRRRMIDLLRVTVGDGQDNGNNGMRITVASAARSLGVSETTARRVLEELEVIKIAVKVRKVGAAYGAGAGAGASTSGHVYDDGGNGKPRQYGGGWMLSEWGEARLNAGRSWAAGAGAGAGAGGVDGGEDEETPEDEREGVD